MSYVNSFGESIGERIKRIRLSKGLTLLQLAERIGKSEATVQRYESGQIKSLNNHVIADISSALGVNPGYLMGWEDFEAPSTNYNFINRNLKRIPNLGNVSVGPLSIIDSKQKENLDYVDIPERFLGKYAKNESLFAMTVDVESMSKVVKYGSLVIVKEMQNPDYNDGDIVVFKHGGEYSLKRFLPADIEDFILFKSESYDNSIKDIAIPIDTELDSKIYGKVITYVTTLD